MRKVLKRNNVFFIRLVSGLAAFAVIVVCGFRIATAVQYDAITVQGTSGNITVKGNQISGLSITPALVFNQTGDSITYQLTLENPDRYDFRIADISDDNTNEYIITSYEYSDDIDTENKNILITLSYASYIPLGDELDLQDIHISIDIEEDVPAETNSATGTVATPNTGSVDGARFLKGSGAVDSQSLVTPMVAIVFSVAVIFTVLPRSRSRRMNFSKISAVVLGVTLSGIAVVNVSAQSTVINLTIFGADISAVSDTANPQEVVSAIFPNIYNGNQAIYQERADYAAARGSAMAPGNNIILKTLDNKYIMMDTGPNFASIRENIYNELYGLQGTEQVHLDYLVISHLDGDHNGNAVALLKDSRFKIDNIVFKTEVYPGKDVTVFVKNAITAAQARGTNVITSGGQDAIDYLNSISASGYQMLTEGEVVTVGKYLKLDFYNTSNVYSGKYCRTGYTINWTANPRAADLYKTASGEYVYFDGSEYRTSSSENSLTSTKFPYADVELKTTTNPVAKTDGSGINRYFYATDSSLAAEGNQLHDICVRNPNSFGILAEVTTTNLKRYMYFPGDIENAGASLLSGGANSAQLYDEITFKNGDFKASDLSYSIPAEDDTAFAIRGKLAADAKALGLSQDMLLNNIVIYQMSHHGLNNSEKAVWALNLNRSSGIYAIEENNAEMQNANGWRYAKTYGYTLGDVPAENKIRVGSSTISSGTVTSPVLGVGCSIDSNGTTICVKY